LANSALLLILIRFFEGIAVGIIAIIVPLYLAELAPPSKRGLFVTAYQLSLALGTFAAFFINHFYSLSGSWRLMFFATAYPACLLSLSLFSFKESPKWLLYSAHSQNVNKECLTPQGRLVFKIGAGLILFQQLSAINAFVHFFPKIFALAGCVNTQNALFFTLLVGGVNVLATFPALFLMDRMGRRVLLLLSQTGIILSLLALLFIFGVQTLCTDRMVLMALIAFIISFALGLGPVTWVLVSEIFPMTLRAKGLSCMVFLSYASSYLVVQSFPFLITHLSVATTFALYSALSIYALWFFWRWIPETKGKSLEEVQKILHH
jgi:MFS family permease